MSLVRELVTFFADEAEIPVSLVFSNDRRAAVSWVRAMTIKWLRAHEAGYTTTGIGMQLEMDHSSVCHATKRVWPAKAPALRHYPKPKPETEIVPMVRAPKAATIIPTPPSAFIRPVSMERRMAGR